MWNGVTEIFIEILEILIWRYQSEWFQICLNVSSGKKYIISTGVLKHYAICNSKAKNNICYFVNVIITF